MKPTNSWETTSFPMAYFHERSWKIERIFTRKCRREKQLDAEQSLECLGVAKQVHLTTVASTKKNFSVNKFGKPTSYTCANKFSRRRRITSGKVYLQSTRKNDDTYIDMYYNILFEKKHPAQCPTYLLYFFKMQRYYTITKYNAYNIMQSSKHMLVEKFLLKIETILFCPISVSIEVQQQ